jgi:hypothetical protein
VVVKGRWRCKSQPTEFGFARRQGTEGPGDQRDRLRFVEIADQRDFHRAVRQPVGHGAAQVGEAAGRRPAG